jgi:hypothetical protein
MKRLLAVGVVALLAGAAAYVLFFAGPPTDTFDPLSNDRKLCGDADPLKGDHLENCISLAYGLMGRENVTINDDAARALLKKTCDRAYQPGCSALAEFDAHKLFVLEGRCRGAWFAADLRSCLQAGRAHEEGVGCDRSGEQARTWYGKACKGGLKEGCERAERVTVP